MKEYLDKTFVFTTEEVEQGRLDQCLKKMRQDGYWILATHTMQGQDGQDRFVALFYDD